MANRRLLSSSLYIVLLLQYINFLSSKTNTNTYLNGQQPTNYLCQACNLTSRLCNSRCIQKASQINCNGFYKSRVCYYSNSVSTFNQQRLIISGDISLNPGPDKCSVCSKTIARNHRALSCDQCEVWCHIKCGLVSTKEYRRFQALESFSWICPSCRLPAQVINEINDDSRPASPDSQTESTVYNDLLLPLKGLNLCHINVCSLTNKVDEIKLLLCQHIASRKRANLLLGLSETFLDDSWNSACLHVDQYTILRSDRKNKKGGGVLLYVPERLPFKRRPDLEVDGVECIWIEINFPRSQSILVSYVYRPPSSDVSYLELLDHMLAEADTEGN